MYNQQQLMSYHQTVRSRSIMTPWPHIIVDRNAAPTTNHQTWITTQISAISQHLTEQWNNVNNLNVSSYYSNGFKFDSKATEQIYQYQNKGIFDNFQQMDEMFNLQVNAVANDCTLLFTNFIFASLNNPFYNKYSIFDFVSFFYCQNHTQSILNNFNNETVTNIRNLLLNMKKYSLQHGVKLEIPLKIYRKCLQLDYNQMMKKGTRKCTIFARIFNLLIHFDDCIASFCACPTKVKDMDTRYLNTYDVEHFQIFQLMCDCLIEHVFYFSGSRHKLFYQNCQLRLNTMLFFRNKDNPQPKHTLIKQVLSKVINRTIIAGYFQYGGSAIASIMANLIRIVEAYAKVKITNLDLIKVTIDLLIENGKNNAMTGNDNYSQKLWFLRIFLSICLDKQNVSGTLLDRRVIDTILSKIYSFDDDDIDKCSPEFDTLCRWWIYICNTQRRQGIELCLFQIENILPSPKVLKALMKQLMTINTSTAKCTFDGMSTQFMSMNDIMPTHFIKVLYTHAINIEIT